MSFNSSFLKIVLKCLFLYQNIFDSLNNTIDFSIIFFSQFFLVLDHISNNVDLEPFIMI